MKKRFGKVLSVFLAFMVFVMPDFPVYAVKSQNDCSHNTVHIEVGAIVSEGCYAVVREYEERCALCGNVITHGTVSIPKETPTHTFAWRSAGCNPYTHIHVYERCCIKCGFVIEAFEVPCNGNCVIPDILNMEETT